ncbi:MAG: LemA family protein [Ottowia sp.]|nr:LemA family protein [Ottowia sp.]
MKGIGVLATIVGIVAAVLFFAYNGLLGKEEAVFAAWANVESTLQRRADLIPNLVSTVKGYAQHEQETFNQITEARAKATQPISTKDLSNPAAMQQFQNSQAALGSALSRLLVIAENYPELKANQNFLDLQHQLEGTENRVNVARERYNDAVRVFNGAIRALPGKLINDLFLHLENKEYFKAAEQAREVPKVSF